MLKKKLNVLKECERKPHLRRIVVMAINTGMDKGVTLNFKWSDIQNDHFCTIRKKTKRPFRTPVNSEVATLLKEIRKEQGLASKHIFTNKDRRIKDIDIAFRAAINRANIDYFTFGDFAPYFRISFSRKGQTAKRNSRAAGTREYSNDYEICSPGAGAEAGCVNSLNGLNAYVKNDLSQIE